MNREDLGELKNLYENVICEQPLASARERTQQQMELSRAKAAAGKAANAARMAAIAQRKAPGNEKAGFQGPPTPGTTTVGEKPSVPTKVTPAKPGMSSAANATTAQKIAGGMSVYKSQVKSGDIKGAEATGKATWALANPTLANKPKTPNPLMDKTFGYQTGNSPKEQQSRADSIINSGKVAAIKPQKPMTQSNSYEWPSAKTIRDIADAYSSIYEAKKKDQDQDGDNDFADIRIARMIASGVPKEVAIAKVRGKSYNEEVEIDEATAMAKRGYDETEIRNKIAKSTGGGKSADRATALENRPTYGDGAKQSARQRLARAQRGDFRKTTSSSPGLHGYGHKSDDPAVKAKQAARGAQRGALTPREKKQLNREAYEAYEFVASYLLENNFAETLNDANVIIENMSDNWFEIIMEEKKPLPVAKMKRKESKLLDNEEGQLQALRTDVGSKERKARMKELQRFDNINSARTSIAKRGGKQQHSMPEVGRYKPKDED